MFSKRNKYESGQVWVNDGKDMVEVLCLMIYEGSRNKTKVINHKYDKGSKLITQYISDADKNVITAKIRNNDFKLKETLDLPVDSRSFYEYIKSLKIGKKSGFKIFSK